MILTTYAHFVSFFRNFSHFSLALQIFVFFWFKAHTHVSCYLKNLYRHAHCWTKRALDLRWIRSIKSNNTTQWDERQTMRHHFTGRISLALSFYLPSNYGYWIGSPLFVCGFSQKSSSWADSRAIYAIRIRKWISAFFSGRKISTLQATKMYTQTHSFGCVQGFSWKATIDSKPLTQTESMVPDWLLCSRTK